MQQRGKRDDDLLLIEYQLGAEPAADIRRHDANFVFVATEKIAKQAHRHVRRLRRAVKGQPIFDLIVRGDNSTAFDGMAAAAVRPEFFAEHMRGAREGGIDITVGQVKFCNEIVRGIMVRCRRTALQRSPAIRNRRQRLEIDIEQRCRVLGNRSGRRRSRWQSARRRGRPHRSQAPAGRPAGEMPATATRHKSGRISGAA